MQKILIIEDEAEVREVLVSSLRLHGFETIEAENGRAGVQLARVYLPDLILSDIRMEGFDGFAALAAVRYQPLTSAIPVVLMTGQPDEQGRRFAMELGADDYLAKPFTIAALVATIHVRLKKQAAIKQQALNPKTVKSDREAGTGAAEALTPVEGGLPPLREMPLVPGVATPRGTAQVAAGGGTASAAAGIESRTATVHASVSVHQVESLVETYLRMLNRFHPNLGNTAMRAVALCRALAGVLDLSAKESQDLCCAAALHDISLVGLDQEAVGRWLRDSRKVTEEEEAFIKKHPLESQLMLADLPVFEAVGQVVRAHHEHWDGSGYPDGLKQEAIPWLPRLLSAAIYYCSQHTLGMAAVKVLRSQSGRMFDPKAVEIVVSAASKTNMPRGVREILLNEMKAGQVVAKEIYNSAGMVLVRNSRELTDPLIGKIIAINRVTPLDQYILVYC